MAAAIVVVAAIWGVALPRLASEPAVAKHIELMQSRGVDPSAKFYTELDALPRVLAAIDKAKLAEPQAWWTPSRNRRANYMGVAGGVGSGTRAVGVRPAAGSQ